MNNYYHMKINPNEKTGLPAVGTEYNVDYYDDNEIYAFQRSDFPEIIQIKNLVLDQTCEIRDILGTAMLDLNGVLLNEKSKNIFQDFVLPVHRFYPAFLKYKKEIYNYFLLQTGRERDIIDYLNYKKSLFYLKKDIIDIEKEPIEINSIKDIKDFKKNLGVGQTIKIKTAFLKKEFLNLNIDLFKIGRLSIDWIVSERLKEALELAEITGVEFKEATNLKVEE
jgi:hypothetical protein